MGRKMKGTIYKRGGVWWLEYRKNGARERVSLDVGGKIAAREKANSIITAASTGGAEAVRKLAAKIEEGTGDVRNSMALDGAWDRHPYEWSSPRKSARRRLAPRNVKENELGWKKFVKWAADVGVTTFGEVTAAVAEKYSQSMLKRGVSGSRHNALISVCRVMWQLAGLENGPFEKIKRVVEFHQRREHLEPDEVSLVVGKADGEMRRLLLIGAYTGLRLGDCCTLKWEMILHGTIFKTNQHRTRKTGAELSLPIHPMLTVELDRTPAKERAGFLVPWMAALYIKDPSSVAKRVRLHFKNSGLVTREGEKGERQRCVRGFHSLRHSFITFCARAGVPIGVIRDWVGHTSEDITRIYEHWGHDAGKDAILKALPALKIPKAGKK